MTIDLRSGLSLDEPDVLLAWGTPVAELPPSLVAVREKPRSYRPAEWTALVRIFGERWRLVLEVDARDVVRAVALEPPPGEGGDAPVGEPEPRAEQLAKYGPHIARRRAGIVDALGTGAALDARWATTASSWRWEVQGAVVLHEIRWLSERGVDDGALDERALVTPSR